MKYLLSIVFFSLVFSSSLFAQSNISEPASVKELMRVKEEVIKLQKSFQIQIYNGSLENAKEAEQNAKTSFSLPTEMSFETPNYKVRVGKFRTRMEAEKMLSTIKESYPSAFIIYI